MPYRSPPLELAAEATLLPSFHLPGPNVSRGLVTPIWSVPPVDEEEEAVQAPLLAMEELHWVTQHHHLLRQHQPPELRELHWVTQNRHPLPQWMKTLLHLPSPHHRPPKLPVPGHRYP